MRIRYKFYTPNTELSEKDLALAVTDKDKLIKQLFDRDGKKIVKDILKRKKIRPIEDARGIYFHQELKIMGLIIVPDDGSIDNYQKYLYLFDNYLNVNKSINELKNIKANINDVYTKQQSDEKFLSNIKTEFQKEPNGYVKLPNGLILQWGCTDNPKGDSGAVFNDKKTMHFPISFPNRCLSVNLSDTLGWAGETTYVGAMIISFDNSSFVFYNDWDSFDYTSYSSKYSIPFPNGFYHYIAIGF